MLRPVLALAAVFAALTIAVIGLLRIAGTNAGVTAHDGSGGVAGFATPSPTPSATPFPTPACPDIDGDGAVTTNDLWIGQSWYLNSVPPAPVGVDRDGDGIILTTDLLSHYLTFGSKGCAAAEPSGCACFPTPVTPVPYPEMSLTVSSPSATCDGPKPEKCFVPSSSTFTVSISTHASPATAYLGFQTQFFYDILAYKPLVDAHDEVLAWEETLFDGRAPYAPTGLEGSVRHRASALFGSGSTTYVGSIVELELNCQKAGNYTLALPSRTLTNPQGSAYILDVSFDYVAPLVTGTALLDLDGDTTAEIVDVADSLEIVCSGPQTPTLTHTPTKTKTPTITLTPTMTDTPTNTPTPTTTPTPTITPTKQPDPGDTDGDGCSDAQENGPDENLGGRRSHVSYWDFYDVWTHPPGQPTAWERNKVINVFDILAVALRFGPGPVADKQTALAAALTQPVDEAGYHPAYDRGLVIGANNWNRAGPDGSINIVDDILGIAQQFGHTCM